MKDHISKLLHDVLQKIGAPDVVPEVAIVEDFRHGDYATNIAMKLAKPLKKSPMVIALQVKEELMRLKNLSRHKNSDHNSIKNGTNRSHKFPADDVLSAIDRVEVAPPGFINFFLSEAKISTHLSQVLQEQKRFGTIQTKNTHRVTVEFTDPNPFKEFHIGHLYSNAVGESVSRLLEAQGHTVRRVNYQGDVGMHVAKALYGLLQDFNIDETLKKLEKQPLADRAKFLGQAYAVGAKAFEEDKQAAESMKELNKLAFIAAQRMWEQEKGTKPFIDYNVGAEINHAKLDKVSKVYLTGRKWSLEYFEAIYKRLGTMFGGYYFESYVGEHGAKTVRDHIADGVFEESDGAVIYRGEKKGLHTRVFINALGLPTYEAKELGLAPTKYADWAYDRSIIVTGNEINEYFKVLLAALSETNPDLASKTTHMGHGMVRKSDGSKMSSRSGAILTGEGLLDEVKESIYTLIDKNKSKYSKEDRESIAETAAVAAVKYSLLRVSLPSDVAFDIETSVAFDGDSGPYLLYTYARCQSVLRKSKREQKLVEPESMNAEEKALARMIYFYPEVVAEAAGNLAPNVMCAYLFKLAQLFNAFYQKHPILSEENADQTAFRLLLTGATAQVIQNGLHLLGIKTVEQM